MVQTRDHMLTMYRKRADPDAREAYVLEKEEEASLRRTSKAKGKRKKKQKKRTDLISMQLPESIVAGQPIVIRITHTLPEEMGEQLVHVTIKGGQNARRIERQVITIAGGEVGPVARKYYDAITGIQYGKAEDPLGWVVPVVQ